MVCPIEQARSSLEAWKDRGYSYDHSTSQYPTITLTTLRLAIKASQITNIIITAPKKEINAPNEEIIFQNNILSA